MTLTTQHELAQMKPRQLAIDLFPEARYAADSFLVGDSNRLAARLLINRETWPSHALVLHGPPRSGKTHLAHIWAANAKARFTDPDALSVETVEALQGQAVVVEDAERVDDEKALFHLFNLVRESGGRLLLTSALPLAGWGNDLPDLTSRLAATPAVEILEPDDDLLVQLMQKLAADRQIALSADVAKYLSENLQRSFATAERAVRLLDLAALAGKRRLTKRLAGPLLDQIDGSE